MINEKGLFSVTHLPLLIVSEFSKRNTWIERLYCTKIYPIALMFLSPLSGERAATFPHVLEPPLVPNPILELQEPQSFCWLATQPILAIPTALKPSLLQFSCKEPCAPINFFHSLRPREVARYVPSAISECRELACLLKTINLSCPLIFIPRQILEKGVFQQVGNLVSCESNPVLPPRMLYWFLSLQQ